MTLDELIDLADDSYNLNALSDSGHLIRDYHERPRKNHGDTMAKFIAVELKDTFDPDATDAKQLEEAGEALRRAASDLLILSRSFARRSQLAA